MPALAIQGGLMEKKKVSISQKRQITIPQKFFTLLGFDKEAECIMRGNELVIRPVKENVSGEFAAEILEDLIKKGYSGQKLLNEFKIMQAKVRPAVELMLAEAEQVANGDGEYFTYDDVFNSEDDE